MPFIEAKPKSISQRHYFGSEKGYASVQKVTQITEAVDQVATNTDYLNDLEVLLTHRMRWWIDTTMHQLHIKQRSFKAYIEQQVWAIPDNVYTIVPYNQVQIQGNMYNTKTYQYRIAEPGIYLFGACLYHYENVGDAWNNTDLAIFQNGVFKDLLAREYVQSRNRSVNGTTILDCRCGDLIDIRIRCDTTSGIQTAINDPLYGYFYGSYQGCNFTNTGYQNPTFTP